MSLHSPSLGPSSPSPSSSAVTIPIPGKSILKKPPPAQAGLFSGSLSKLSGGLSRFFPGERDASASSSSGFGNSASGSGNTGGNSGGNGAGGKEKEKDAEAARVLKRAHFILPEIAVVYPINSLAPPSTPTLRDEKRAIEDRERERRRRVVRANSSSSLNLSIVTANGGDTASVRTQSSGGAKEKEGGEEAEWWAMDKHTINASPDRRFLGRAAYFHTTASILADVLSIEWGLRKAVFRKCDLDELRTKMSPVASFVS
ncbi:hypothetical protein K438DRAFT_2021132 [Mycena galopus ATCC 62051]|nr:hypothetical protein K438DRAFT_2021132 [Mycena galopus ATCC 62051]